MPSLWNEGLVYGTPQKALSKFQLVKQKNKKRTQGQLRIGMFIEEYGFLYSLIYYHHNSTDFCTRFV